MALFGFIALCCIMLLVSLFAAIAAFNNLGKYNVGGSDNSGTKQILTLLFIAFVVWLWIELINNAPFSITMT